MTHQWKKVYIIGGIQFFKIPEKLPTREELAEKWIGYFKGENDV